jgi:glycogen operon protein
MLGSFMSSVSQDPILRTVKLIAEPWDVGPGGYQVGEFPILWAEWNDKYRDAMRSYWRGSGSVSELARRFSGSADLYLDTNKGPQSSINYVTAHDGFTLHDLVSFEHKHNEANGEHNRDGTDNNLSANYGHEGETNDPTINAIRRRQARNLLTSLFLSTGVPMLCAGDEIGRTQLGNNNAYCQDNVISWVDWDLAPWQDELREYTARVAQIRRDHRVFRQRSFFDGRPIAEHGRKDVMWMTPNGVEMAEDDWNQSGSGALAMWLSGDVHANDAYRPWSDDTFVLLMNATLHDVDFTLPGEPVAYGYARVLDTASGHGHSEPLSEVSPTRVPSRSMVVLLAHHGTPWGA